jgi:hypothetical protein
MRFPDSIDSRYMTIGRLSARGHLYLPRDIPGTIWLKPEPTTKRGRKEQVHEKFQLSLRESNPRTSGLWRIASANYTPNSACNLWWLDPSVII